MKNNKTRTNPSTKDSEAAENSGRRRTRARRATAERRRARFEPRRRSQLPLDSGRAVRVARNFPFTRRKPPRAHPKRRKTALSNKECHCNWSEKVNLRSQFRNRGEEFVFGWFVAILYLLFKSCGVRLFCILCCLPPPLYIPCPNAQYQIDLFTIFEAQETPSESWCYLKSKRHFSSPSAPTSPPTSSPVVGHTLGRDMIHDFPSAPSTVPRKLVVVVLDHGFVDWNYVGLLVPRERLEFGPPHR